MADQITKIYELKSLGYDNIIGELNSVNKAFQEIKKTKQDLNKLRIESNDAEALREQKEQTDALRLAEQKLKNEKLLLTNEAKAAMLVRQQEINQAKAQKAANEAVEGSYSALLKTQRELYALVKAAPKGGNIDFRGQNLSFDQAITKLKQLSAAEQDFRRQFSRDQLLVGEYTSGIVQAFKNMGLGDLVGGQITKAQARLAELNESFEKTKQELSSVRVTGQGSLQALENELIQNRKEALALQQQVGTLNAEFRGAGDVGAQVSRTLKEGFQNAKQQLGQMVLQFVGFQAAIAGVQKGVDIVGELSDQTTNLEVEFGKAAGGMASIVDLLAKLDTRTKLPVLEEIANIAAKAGVSEQNLVGVTAAIDKIKIAFGKDFGNVEEGTEALVKIINIFEGADNVTGDTLLRVGNAVRTLANESVASVPFLNDFTQRMAGLKGISDISLPSVLGLASGFEQFGQSAEVSSTALVQIIPKLAKDTEKYAAVAGVTHEAFQKLIKDNPAEALIKVAEGLAKGKSGIEEISQSFADSELGRGRVTTILATVGANADAFRHSIESAGTAFSNTSNITDAYAAKNNNLAATLDKISKKFADAANSKAFQIAITAISSVVLLLINNLPILVFLAGTMAAAWAVQNAQLILLNASTLAYNILIARNYVALGILTVANGVYQAGLFLLNGTYALVTRAAALFNITLRSTPLGLVLTGIALLASAWEAFGSNIQRSTEKLQGYTRQSRIQMDIETEARKSIIETISQEKLYQSIAADTTLSMHTREEALKKLIAINPEYLSGLTLQNIKMQEGKNILDAYNKSLYDKAIAEAGANRVTREFQQLVALQTVQADVETAIKSGKGVDLKLVSAELLDKLANTTATPFLNSAFLAAAKGLGSTLDDAGQLRVLQGIISKAIGVQEGVIKDATKAADDLTKKNQALIKPGAVPGGKPGETITLPDTIDDLKKELKAINLQILQTNINAKQLDELKARRDLLKAKIKALLGEKTGTTPPPRADRLAVDDQNRFKDIDAARDEALTKQRADFELRKISEEVFLQNILAINVKAINSKLALLDASNAEERRKIGELHLARITSESETNDKIFAIHQKALEDQLANDKRDAEALGATVVNNPAATGLDRAQVKLKQDQAMLEAQEKFNAQMDALERKYGVTTKTNAEQRADILRKINQDLFNDTNKVLVANLEDIKRAGEENVAEFNILMDKAKIAILNNNALSNAQKATAIRKLENERDFGILARQAAMYKVLEAEFKKALDAGVITLQQYEEIVAKLAQLQGQVNTSSPKSINSGKSLSDLVGGKVGKALGAEDGSELQRLVGEGISRSYSLAQDAMQSFYDNERNRIQQSRDLALERIDLEYQQVKARTTSNDALAQLDKEYAAKKRRVEQQAGEQLKKSKRAEAKLALATELAGIAASAALNPANAPTFGAAGAIMYSILSAIAIGRYALRVSDINRESFAHGGPVPTRGGKFGGKPHSQGGTPFEFKGRQFEAEADELAVIRTRNAPANKVFTISGNQAQIASMLNEIGGGVRFAPGAKIKRFADGGFIGESLQAPIFSPIIAGAGGGEMGHVLEVMVEHSKAIQAVSGRIDRIQVVQDPKSVQTAQRKLVSQSNVGTL